MRIDDLTPRQLMKLQEAKADVVRDGFLNQACTDQQFLDALTVHRRTRELFDVLGSALRNGSPRLRSVNKAFEAFAAAAEQLWDKEGVWDADGWRST